MLVAVSIPTLSMLFLQNKQVQTVLSDFITRKFATELQVDISISKVHYSFFKRLQVHDFYVADLNGDTLLYAEVANARIKRFRPDKLDVQLKNLTFENAYCQIIMDDKRIGSIQFLVDYLKRDIPADEKVVLKIEQMNFIDSRFRRLDSLFVPPATGIDLSDMDIRNVNVEINDFLFLQDTTYMNFS